MLRAWKQILRFCDNSYEELRDTLNWGATEAEVDQLQHGLGNAAQKVALIVLGQKLGQVHVRLGHRGLRMVRG